MDSDYLTVDEFAALPSDAHHAVRQAECTCGPCTAPDPSTTWLGKPIGSAPARDPGADDLAITAFGAYKGYGDVMSAIGAWRMLAEDERVNWRASADGVRIVIELRGADA